MLFVLPSHNYLEDVEGDKFTLKHFSDGEIHVHIHEDVKGKTCMVLGTTAPPEENFFSLLLLSSILKKEGAQKVIASIPYFGYARQDKAGKGEALTMKWIGDVMKASGINKVVTIDIHSNASLELIGIPIISIPPSKLFDQILSKFDLSKVTFVAPDEGAVNNAKALSENIEISYFKKKRTDEGIELLDLLGSVKKDVIIHDDILSTGGTLVESCRRLQDLGVENITIIVTHGLFLGSKWEELWSLGVNHIYTTNTTPQAVSHESDKITVLPVHNILIDSI